MTITAKATGPARIKLLVWPTAHPASITETAWKNTNASQAATFKLNAVGTAGHGWSWRAVIQDQAAVGAATQDAVRTVPWRPKKGVNANFRFVVSSCMVLGLPAPALRVAVSANPVFFGMIGDMGYVDTKKRAAQDYRLYSNQFRDFLNHADSRPLLAKTALVGMQDDHDYGQDECDRTSWKPYAAQAFADLIPGAVATGISYRKWSVGAADFFLLDNRRFQDPKEGPFENGQYHSVLGNRQRTWLTNNLAASTARVKFVLAPMTFTWYWSDGEKKALVNFIERNVSGKVIFCTGDKHAAALVRPSTKTYQMLGGPINIDVKSPTHYRPNVLWTENGTGTPYSNVIGLVHVATTSNRVLLRLMREDGVELARVAVPI